MPWDWIAMPLVIAGSYFLYGSQYIVVGLLLMLGGTVIIMVLMKRAGYTGLVVMQIRFMMATLLSFYEKYGAR